MLVVNYICITIRTAREVSFLIKWNYLFQPINFTLAACGFLVLLLGAPALESWDPVPWLGKPPTHGYEIWRRFPWFHTGVPYKIVTRAKTPLNSNDGRAWTIFDEVNWTYLMKRGRQCQRGGACHQTGAKRWAPIFAQLADREYSGHHLAGQRNCHLSLDLVWRTFSFAVSPATGHYLVWPSPAFGGLSLAFEAFCAGPHAVYA